MEKIILYEYSTLRSKFKKTNKLPSALKRKLLAEHGNVCYICRKLFDKSHKLQLEHKIPVMVGGHLFADYNTFLVCKRCHSKKTRIDKMVIHLLRKAKIIKGTYFIASYYSIDKVIEFYIMFRDIVLFNDKNHDIHMNGRNGVDYIQMFQKSNRK